MRDETIASLLEQDPPETPGFIPDLDEVVRRARRGRLRRLAVGGVAGLVLAAGVAVPLVLLSPLGSRHPRPVVTKPVEALHPEVVGWTRVQRGAADIAVGDGSLWVSGASELLRVDPVTDAVTRIPIPGVGDYSGIALGEGAVWVTADGGYVDAVDARTNRIFRTIRVGGYPQSVVVGGGYVWAVGPGSPDGSLVQIDPRTGGVVRRVRVGVSPAAVVYARGSVWIAHNAGSPGLWRVDPKTGQARPFGSFGGLQGIAFGGGFLWAVTSGADVDRIDPSTGHVRAVFVPRAERVAFGHRAVWTLTYPPSTVPGRFEPSPKHPGTLRVIDPSTMQLVGRPLPVQGLQPVRVASGMGAVWALDYDGGIVTEVDPSGGPSPIVLDRPYDNRRFVLAPAGTRAGLSAAQALAAFESVDPQFHPPAGTAAHLGYLTVAIGNNAYSYLHRLAWGYRWFECPTLAAILLPGATLPPACTRWLFLDANSGEMLEAVFQH